MTRPGVDGLDPRHIAKAAQRDIGIVRVELDRCAAPAAPLGCNQAGARAAEGIKDETAAAIPRCAKDSVTTLDFLLKARKEPSIKKNHLIDLARIGGFDGLAPESRLLTVAAINYALARTTAKQTDAIFTEHWNTALKFIVLGEMSPERKSQTEVDVFGSFNRRVG